MNIAEIRKKYPQYDDLSDTELARALHGKFYSDLDFAEFSKKIGLQTASQQPAQQKKVPFWQYPSGLDFAPAPTEALQPRMTTPEQRDKYVSTMRGAVGTALPIAGDIAGTMMAPQIKGPQMAGRAVNLLSRMFGAGIGGGMGSAAGQFAETGEVDTGEMAEQAGIGAGGEAMLSALGPVAKFTIKPLGKFASEFTIFGSASLKRLRDKLVKRSTNRAVNFLEDIAPDSIKSQDVGIGGIAAKVNAAMDESRAAYAPYREALSEYAEKQGGKIPLDDTSQMLGDLKETLAEQVQKRSASGKPPSKLAIENAVLKEMGYTPTTGFELKKVMREDLADPRQIEHILATFSKGWNKLTPSQQAAREKLKQTILDDISRLGGKDAAVLKKSADENFKSVVRFKKLHDIFEKAIVRTPETGEMYLQPSKLADLIYDNKTVLQRDMPDLWPKLKAEADYYRSIAPEFAKRGHGPGLSSGSGMAIAYTFGGPSAIPVAEGFGIASAYALLDPATQKVIKTLAKGVKPIGKAGLHMAGSEIDFGDIMQ